MRGLPEPDYLVTEDVVRSLLGEQFPDLAELPISFAGEGFDNYLWRIGESLLMRIPRREIGVRLIKNEIEWLPRLAPRLPIEVPVALRVGEPSASYGHPWVITRWFDGEPADVALFSDERTEARRLAEFLRALHVRAPADAPSNPFRCLDMATRTDTFEGEVAEINDPVREVALREVWQQAESSQPWKEPPLWIHGDLHPGNLVVRNGALRAVVDFGDSSAGDPAIDLAGAWMLFALDAVDDFLVSYQANDDDLVARALGWAALFGLFAFNIGNSNSSRAGDVGDRTLSRVIEFSVRNR